MVDATKPRTKGHNMARDRKQFKVGKRFWHKADEWDKEFIARGNAPFVERERKLLNNTGAPKDFDVDEFGRPRLIVSKLDMMLGRP